MWILFRLAMFIAGMVYRFISVLLINAQFKTYPGGVSLYIKNKKNPKTGQESSKIYLKIKSRVFFRMIPENAYMRWFKSIGFGQELEVGEKTFDEAFFVAAESSGIITKLRGDSELRAIFLKLYDLGFTRFISDGFGHLLIENPRRNFHEFDAAIRDLGKIKTALDIIPSSSFLSTPNVIWILALEIIGYGIAAYAASFHISAIFDTGMTHLYLTDYIIKSFITVIALILAWFVLVVVFLRRTARGLILLTDFTLVYCLIALVAGFILFGDLNQTLDKSPKSLNIAEVQNQFSRRSGSGKSRRTVFFLTLNYAKNPDRLPVDLSVSRAIYDGFTKGDGIEITVRDGFFHSPYIEGIRAIPNPSHMSAANEIDDSKVTYQQARDLALWVPTRDPKSELSGPVTWVEEKYPSGKIRQREPFVQNTRHGIGTYWHENGKLYTNISWMKGQKNGRIKLYYPSGRLEQSLNYQSGQLHGICAWYDQDGLMTHMALYDTGEVISADMKFLSDIAKEIPAEWLK